MATGSSAAAKSATDSGKRSGLGGAVTDTAIEGVKAGALALGAHFVMQKVFPGAKLGQSLGELVAEEVSVTDASKTEEDDRKVRRWVLKSAKSLDITEEEARRIFYDFRARMCARSNYRWWWSWNKRKSTFNSHLLSEELSSPKGDVRKVRIIDKSKKGVTKTTSYDQLKPRGENWAYNEILSIITRLKDVSPIQFNAAANEIVQEYAQATVIRGLKKSGVKKVGMTRAILGAGLLAYASFLKSKATAYVVDVGYTYSPETLTAITYSINIAVFLFLWAFLSTVLIRLPRWLRITSWVALAISIILAFAVYCSASKGAEPYASYLKTILEYIPGFLKG